MSGSSSPQNTHFRQVAAAVVGNAMEWYDFVVFGFFATVMSQLFFPGSDERAALLLTLATFGVGFCSRPVGGMFFGFYADRRGRKAALQSVIFIMTFAVAIIAFAPTYASIGLGGPILMVTARLLQGFATGGEFASSTSFLIEIAPPARRGFYGSLQMAGQGASILLGTLVGIAVTSAFTPDQIHAWAWRLPFFVGLLIGPIGFYIRRHLHESAAFEDTIHERNAKDLIGGLVENHKSKMLAAFGTTISATIYFYVVLIYMPTYAKTELGLSLAEAFFAQAYGLILLVVLTPIVGWLSDRNGRRPMLWISNILFLISAGPLFFYLTETRSQNVFILVQMAFCFMLSGLFGVLSTVLAEQFPTKLRSTGLALPYNLAVMIFGGFAPMIVTWLIGALNSQIAPAYYLMFGSITGLVASFALNEKFNKKELI
jgi:MHS family proline/betaine transporter-like MFS transporter